MRQSNKKIIILGLVVLVLCIILNTIITNNIYKNYQIKIDEKIASILGTLVKNENDDTFIKDIINNENIDIGNKYLKNNDMIISELLIGKKNLKTKLLFTNIVTTSFIFVLFLIILFCYRKKQNKKLECLNEYMNSILNGDYSLDIRDYEEGNLSILKNYIYKMTIKLKEQTDLAISQKNSLENILSDISHQIKTPLTSMYVINDILESDNLTKKEKNEFLSKNKSQLERIERLVVSLLNLSRLENGFIKLKREKIKANKLIEEALESMLIPIELKNQGVILDIDEAILNIDLYWTIEAINNIIKNAYEHTPDGGTIKISVKDNPLYTEIRIEDNGIGIPKKDLPHIFERFYIGSNNKNSIGIGLNMAKKVIELEDGTINVDSKVNQYTIFYIKFYKNVI